MAQDPIQTAQSSQTNPLTGTKSARRMSHRGKGRPITRKPIEATSTKLRLVGSAAPDVKPPTANPTPIRSATDPRWVLAISTAQMMQGSVLPPTKREALMSQGKSMGLSPFDCSLVLAIIQDRARRGIAVEQCPAASESQLALIPLPPMRSFQSALGAHPKRTLLIASGLLALQCLLIWIWLS